MVDKLTTKHRSWNMSKIGGENTKPEKIVRRYLHKNGFRYILHKKTLPGKPDIVLPKYNSIVFVNGCYWHRHQGCQYSYTPKSNTAFWQKKFDDTIARYKRIYSELRSLDWNVLIMWECEINDEINLERLVKILKNRDI